MGGQAPTAAGLLERDWELERLERAVAAAAAGAGSLLALEGEAGVGKTALLSHAIDRAGDAGLRVLSARAGELEREFAYGVVRQLFEVLLVSATDQERARWLAGAARLAEPVMSEIDISPGDDARPGSILHGLYWLAANVAGEQPMLIAVDDAQWADDASIGFLSYLGRRVTELSILVVYASRPGEGASATLPAMAEPELMSMILRPAPLSQAATEQLLEQGLGSPGSADLVRACQQVTNGNPFYLTELVRALHADGIATDALTSSQIESIAPKTITRATLARLRRLGPQARELAFAVAILGSSAELWHAAALAGFDDAVAIDAADALCAVAILRDGRPLEFIHPIVRSAVYSDIAPPRRAACHKRAALLLAQHAVPDALLAPHLLVAARSGDGWVVDHLRAAAREVRARGAPQSACTYLERALAEPPAASVRPAVLLELGRTEAAVARPAALEHLRAVAVDDCDDHTRFDAARELALALAYRGRVEQAVTVSEEALSRLTIDDERRLQLEGDLGGLALLSATVATATLQRLAVYEDKLDGDTPGQRAVLACLAYGAAHRGRTAATTTRLARLALAGGLLFDEQRPGSLPFYLAVSALRYADELSEAERYLDLAATKARDEGSTGDFGGASACRCEVLVRQGRLAEAQAEALSVLSSIDVYEMDRAMLLACLLHTLAERAAPQAAQAFVTEHHIDGDLSDAPLAGLLLFARARLRLAVGDARSALDDLEKLRQRNQISGLDAAAIPRCALQALAHLQLGDRDVAHALADEELERARVWGAPGALACALRTAALVEGGQRGIELHRESVTAAQQSPANYELASSLAQLGAALRRAGQRREARPPLRAALDLADRYGAARLADTVREELRATGARPRRAIRSAVEDLTPSETRVARMAADGLSNPQIAQALFVSLKTVETHLGHVYQKLGIRSRHQLPELVADQRSIIRPAPI
jgi:DNA-binding CsgD family transcriptional regulator